MSLDYALCRDSGGRDLSNVSVVLFDDTKRRAVTVLTTPLEVHGATGIAGNGYSIRSVAGIDLDAQTIQGVPIADVYARVENRATGSA